MIIQGRKLLITCVVVLVFGLGLWFARLYILSQIKVKLEDRLFALRDAGYLVHYDSISVNTNKNEVEIHHLIIKREIDSAACHSSDFFSSSYIKAEGFRFMPLLLKKKLSFDVITIDSPRMVVNQSFFQKKSNNSQGTEFTIFVSKLNLPHLRFSYLDSTCTPNTSVSLNTFVKNFTLSFYEDRKPFYNISLLRADSLNINLHHEYYNISVREMRLNLDLGLFDLDTMKISPQLSKVELGRKKNKQVDRIEGLIPYINLYGLDLNKDDSLDIAAKKMTVQLFLKVFRDKRQPFRNPYRPLPNEALANLPFGLSIDSLVLNKSYIEYEEFAEEADSAGNIFFDDVYACLKNINNRQQKISENIDLRAAGQLYGQGDLNVQVAIPHDPSRKTSVSGSLQNFDFEKLNEMLEPQARIRAESGHLHQLDFRFAYDNNRSHGAVELKYNNLKMVSFRSNDQIDKKIEKKRKHRHKSKIDEERMEKAPIKTFVLNNFILKKNIDDNAIENRSGEISFTRDKRRSVFNYWAKSLLSGLKSAYNIDKIEDSRLKKMLDKKNK